MKTTKEQLAVLRTLAEEGVVSLDGTLYENALEDLLDDLDEAAADADRLRAAGTKLLDSLGEYVRQSMHANPEWREGIEAMEAAIAEAGKEKS